MKTNNSLAFFQYLKATTEAEWEHIIRYEWEGKHIADGTRWKPGLSEEQLQAFEADMGFTFPEPLRNFYRTMNGLDRPYVGSYEELDGTIQTYEHFAAYSYPDDLEKMREMISWIQENNRVTPAIIQQRGISRIFPLWIHRCMMIDEPGHPILSMHGSDIIFWARSLAHAFKIDFLSTSGRRERGTPTVRFWYPGWRMNAEMPKQRRKTGVMTPWFRALKKRDILRHRAMG